MSNGYDISELLTLVCADRAEGLSLHAGHWPVVHLGGEPHPIAESIITTENAEALLRSLATTRQLREFREHGAAEFIYTFANSTRFSVQARTSHDEIQLELARLGA